MHSLNNLMKWNDQQDKNINYETMNLDELKRNRDKIKILLKNEALILKLSDKGSKLNSQLNKLEVSIFFLIINSCQIFRYIKENFTRK